MDRIIRVKRVSDRVIAVDLVIGEQIVKVVSCYAPQAEVRLRRKNFGDK